MGILSRLQVWEFRNLQQLDLPFGPGVTLLIGSNGQGKSNILEAVCYLGLLRSFRAQGVAELRRWGSPTFTVRGQVDAADAAQRLTLAVSQSDKRLLQVNGSPVERASDFINRFLCVPLVPEDLEMVKGPAAGRRRFLDVSISQRWPHYLAELQQYRAAVASRNLVLRQPAAYPASVLDAYEQQMVRHGARIEVVRRQYAAELRGELTGLSACLLGQDSEGFAVAYACPGVPKDSADAGEETLAQVLLRALQRNRDRDQRDGHTSTGPHRADLSVSLAGKALPAYGSEGECRLACLALRLAALAMARRGNSGNKAVVALVDDVLGELDPVRRRAFLEAVTRADQVLITATECPPELSGMAAAAYGVSKGQVAPL